MTRKLTSEYAPSTLSTPLEYPLAACNAFINPRSAELIYLGTHSSSRGVSPREVRAYKTLEFCKIVEEYVEIQILRLSSALLESTSGRCLSTSIYPAHADHISYI